MVKIPDPLRSWIQKPHSMLKKKLYGLKQATRAWNNKLNQTSSSTGFVRTSSESCGYLKTFDDETVILAIYVDDIIVFF